jgi:hypothetical protein
MSEVQQLETSVMVTERNWSALLEMQDRLFRQQMQLDTDLKMLLTKAEAQESLIKMQTSAENFEKQAGSLNDTKNQLSDMEQTAQKKIITCAWISTAAVILCTALCSLAVLWSR